MKRVSSTSSCFLCSSCDIEGLVQNPALHSCTVLSESLTRLAKCNFAEAQYAIQTLGGIVTPERLTSTAVKWHLGCYKRFRKTIESQEVKYERSKIEAIADERNRHTADM